MARLSLHPKVNKVRVNLGSRGKGKKKKGTLLGRTAKGQRTGRLSKGSKGRRKKRKLRKKKG